MVFKKKIFLAWTIKNPLKRIYVKMTDNAKSFNFDTQHVFEKCSVINF